MSSQLKRMNKKRKIRKTENQIDIIQNLTKIYFVFPKLEIEYFIELWRK